MIKEITKQEFEKRYPETSTYGTDITTVFLENGIILWENDWNGETYEDGYKPISIPIDGTDDSEIIGYELV